MLNDHKSAQFATAAFPADEECAAARVVASMRQAAALLEQLLAVDLSQQGLNQARFAALKFIAHSVADGGCSQTELATGLGQSESSVSGLISRMRADGLLYRLRAAHDQRKRTLMLSAKGRHLLSDCEATYMRQLESVLNRFGPDWLQQLQAHLAMFVNGVGSIETSTGADHPPPADGEVRRTA